MRNIPEKAIVVLSLAASGCTGWVRAEGGFTTSTTFNAGRQGGSAGVEVAVGDRYAPIAFDVALRGKATANAGDAALYMGLLHIHTPKPVGFYVLGGANVLQLGRADGDVSFGMFSPVAEGGLLINAEKKVMNGMDTKLPGMVTLGVRIEYDLRFTSQPHEGFLTANLGYAFGVGSD